MEEKRHMTPGERPVFMDGLSAGFLTTLNSDLHHERVKTLPHLLLGGGENASARWGLVGLPQSDPGNSWGRRLGIMG